MIYSRKKDNICKTVYYTVLINSERINKLTCNICNRTARRRKIIMTAMVPGVGVSHVNPEPRWISLANKLAIKLLGETVL